MHEHIKEYGLINMNGRLYDPIVGRMLSPDIYVQDPTYSPSYNRYSYVNNNPLKYTDPSGYIPYQFQLDNYFNAIDNRDLRMCSDGVYYGENAFSRILNDISYRNVAETAMFIKNNREQLEKNKEERSISISEGKIFTSEPSLIEMLAELINEGHSPDEIINSGVILPPVVVYANGRVDYWKSWNAVQASLDAISGINSLYGSNNVQNGGGWDDKAMNVLGTFGFANEGKNVLISYASKAGNIGDEGLKYLKISKGVSTTAGAVGVLVTVTDGLMGKQGWQNHHTADLAIGIATTFMLSGPWGWAVGGTYFLTDLAVQKYTGRSITENLFDPSPSLNFNKR